MKSRRWNVADPDERAHALADRLRTSPLVAQILLNRGLIEPDLCQQFLRPTLKTLIDPAAMPGLPAAAARVAQAVRDKEKIVIYGDYDVDGITGTSILWHALRLLGGNVTYYIPHRIEEGYGLNCDAVRELCDAGTQLLITVDCGITAIDPIALARERGVDVVVTDHHEWKTGGLGLRALGLGEDANGDSSPSPSVQAPIPVLPNATHIVHPRLGDGSYGNPHICGAGVAFKLAWGVGQAISGAGRVNETLKAFLMEAMALAALGTIADVVPLVGENRIIAHFGLGGLKSSKLTGVQALISSANLDGQKLDSFHVGFLLGPRLNAAGRMGHARLAVEMLTEASPERAIEIATYLESQNRQRQTTERTIVGEAMQQIADLQLIEKNCHGIVVGSAGWHPGVIGIVASRIVDKFHRPTVVVAIEDGLGHGSGRSIDGFHLSNALQACTHCLETHGGHEMAAGLKVREANFEAFREAFIAHAGAQLDASLLIPEMRLDCDAELTHLTEALIHDLSRLGPFGRGNPKPLLRCRDLTLTAPPRRVGKTGDHLQLFLKQNGSTMKAIAFGAAPTWADKLQAGTTVHVACEPQINDYNGRRSVELEVKDLQLAE